MLLLLRILRRVHFPYFVAGVFIPCFLLFLARHAWNDVLSPIEAVGIVFGNRKPDLTRIFGSDFGMFRMLRPTGIFAGNASLKKCDKPRDFHWSKKSSAADLFFIIFFLPSRSPNGYDSCVLFTRSSLNSVTSEAQSTTKMV